MNATLAVNNDIPEKMLTSIIEDNSQNAPSWILTPAGWSGYKTQPSSLDSYATSHSIKASEDDEKTIDKVKETRNKWQTAASFNPQTDLGKKLWAIRQRAINSGMKLLDDDDLLKEVAERRGHRN